MKFLHLIFNIINPDRGSNWLAQRYHRWEYARLQKRNRIWKEDTRFESVYFQVAGAGEICMSDDCHTLTGQVVGFSFGVGWGSYGFCGGVLGRDEAKRMAEFILQKCAETTETMQEEVSMRYAKLTEYNSAQSKETE